MSLYATFKIYKQKNQLYCKLFIHLNKKYANIIHLNYKGLINMFNKIVTMLCILSISASAGEVIIHNGIEYKEVKSPNTGRIWLDRNLGAKEACKSIDDKKCFGNYYQWGRNQDGHEQYNSRVVTTQAKSITNAGKYFINGSTQSYDDWAQKLDSDGSLRVKQWNKKDGSSICPNGYRVPTLDELQEEVTSDMFKSFLKLPFSGRRGDSGNLRNGSFGNIWVNGVKGSYSEFLYYDNDGGMDFGVTERDNGFSVRCIK